MQNLFQATLYTHLAFEPQQRDMRHFSEQQGLHPPELRPGHSAAVATILVTDWAHEPPQPMPPHIHVCSTCCTSLLLLMLLLLGIYMHEHP